jgi:hypothetical protein
MTIRIMLFATANGSRTPLQRADKVQTDAEHVLKLSDVEQSKSAALKMPDVSSVPSVYLPASDTLLNKLQSVVRSCADCRSRTDSLHGTSPSKGLPGPKVIEAYKLRRWTSAAANRYSRR